MACPNHLFAAALLTVALAAAGAAAQTAPLIIDQARAAIAQGNIAEGERLLALVDTDTADPNDVDFLRGTAASAKEDYATAIKHFRAILARDGGLNRVRLDLARAYFLKGDDTAAEHHFRLAMGYGVPPEVQRNISVFLDQIRLRKRWDISARVALAPDTNINAATTAQNVTLFGLPFELDPAARKKSGVGFAGTLTGSYQWPLSDRTRLRVGATFNDREYAAEEFSDRNLSLFAGPRFLFAKGELSVMGTAGRRWLGGDRFTSTAGGRIEAQFQVSPRALVSGAIFGQATDYAPRYAPYSGPSFGGEVALAYSLDGRSFLRASVGVVREQAEEPPLRNSQYSLALGYYREGLPMGFTVYLEARASLIPYDAPLVAFGKIRRDFEMDYRVSLSNARLQLLGFTPTVSYVHTDRYANIPLYAYGRDRVEIGVSRSF